MATLRVPAASYEQRPDSEVLRTPLRTERDTLLLLPIPPVPPLPTAKSVRDDASEVTMSDFPLIPPAPSIAPPHPPPPPQKPIPPTPEEMETVVSQDKKAHMEGLLTPPPSSPIARPESSHAGSTSPSHSLAEVLQARLEEAMATIQELMAERDDLEAEIDDDAERFEKLLSEKEAQLEKTLEALDCAEKEVEELRVGTGREELEKEVDKILEERRRELELEFRTKIGGIEEKASRALKEVKQQLERERKNVEEQKAQTEKAKARLSVFVDGGVQISEAILQQQNMAELEVQVQQLTIRNAHLEKLLTSARKELEDTIIESSTSLATISDLQSQVLDKDVTISDLESRLLAREATSKDLESKIEDLQTTINCLNAQISEKDMSLAALQEKQSLSSHKETEITDFKNKIKELEEQIEDSIPKFSHAQILEQTRKELLATADPKRSSIERYKAKYAAARGEMDRMKVESKELEASNTSLRVDVMKLEERLKKLKEEGAEKETEMFQLRQELRSFEERAAARRERRAKKEEDGGSTGEVKRTRSRSHSRPRADSKSRHSAPAIVDRGEKVEKSEKDKESKKLSRALSKREGTENLHTPSTLRPSKEAYVVIVDGSGSMVRHGHSRALNVYKRLLNILLYTNPRAEVSVLVHSVPENTQITSTNGEDFVKTLVDLAPVSWKMSTALENLGDTYRSTEAWSIAMPQALTILSKFSTSHPGKNRSVILLTDGNSEPEFLKGTWKTLGKKFVEEKIRCHCVVFESDEGRRRSLRTVSADTGGRYVKMGKEPRDAWEREIFGV